MIGGISATPEKLQINNKPLSVRYNAPSGLTQQHGSFPSELDEEFLNKIGSYQV